MNKTLPFVVAICGKRRCGKDTIANYLQNNYNFEHIKISSKLKNVIKILFNFNDNQMESDEKELIDEKWNVSPRQVMQFIGTDIMQYEIQKLLPNVNRSFWIKSLIEEYKNTNKNLVISDLRFLHEYEELKKVSNKIYIIKVERKCSHDLSSTDTHSSETEMINIPCDFIINNSKISDLYSKIDKIINQIV